MKDSRACPKTCYNLASGVNAMTIVVEIASRTDTRAYKEYDAPSVDAAIKEANRELRAYPEFWVTGFSVDRGASGAAKTKGRKPDRSDR